MPLFPGYLFLFGDSQERLVSLQTNRVSQILEVISPARLRAELNHLASLIKADVPLTLESRIEAGQYVRVKSGPLAGLEGIVISRRSRLRLVVAIDYLQQGASFELEDFQVEPI